MTTIKVKSQVEKIKKKLVITMIKKVQKFITNKFKSYLQK